MQVIEGEEQVYIVCVLIMFVYVSISGPSPPVGDGRKEEGDGFA